MFTLHECFASLTFLIVYVHFIFWFTGLKKSSTAEVLENRRKSNPEVEIDINYMDNVRDHFNDAFTNKLYSASMYQIVQILTETFQVSQVSFMYIQRFYSLLYFL